jgi:hypothetical protein
MKNMTCNPSTRASVLGCESCQRWAENDKSAVGHTDGAHRFSILKSKKAGQARPFLPFLLQCQYIRGQSAQNGLVSQHGANKLRCRSRLQETDCPALVNLWLTHKKQSGRPSDDRRNTHGLYIVIDAADCKATILLSSKF